jgi:hypothetical protein
LQQETCGLQALTPIPAKPAEAKAALELALNPQPEPPNKNRKPQKIKKGGDPGKNK